jgi:TPR repeat protein
MYDKAAAHYQQAIDKGDIEAYSNLGLLYYKQNDLAKAEELFTKAVELGSAKALFNLAVLYHNQKRFQDAESNYIHAIGRIKEAKTFFLQLQKDNGSMTPICLPIVFLAQLYFSTGQDSKAIDLLKANS